MKNIHICYWTEIDEGAPRNGCLCVVLVKGKYYAIARFHSKYGFRSERDGIYYDRVTHYIPLLEPEGMTKGDGWFVWGECQHCFMRTELPHFIGVPVCVKCFLSKLMKKELGK